MAATLKSIESKQVKEPKILSYALINAVVIGN
jgi:hypothetical protein